MRRRSYRGSPPGTSPIMGKGSAPRTVNYAPAGALRQPRRRAGRRSRLPIVASKARKSNPTRRNGKKNNQTMGKRIRASKAAGQQRTKRIHQPTNRIRVFTRLPFHGVATCQRLRVDQSRFYKAMPYEGDLLADEKDREPERAGSLSPKVSSLPERRLSLAIRSILRRPFGATSAT
jgi:hypothetical protein